MKAKAYSEPCQTSKMEFFAKLVKGFKPLTIFVKSSILDVWQSSEYAPLEGLQETSVTCVKLQSGGENFRHNFSQCKKSLREPGGILIKEVIKNKLPTSYS